MSTSLPEKYVSWLVLAEALYRKDASPRPQATYISRDDTEVAVIGLIHASRLDDGHTGITLCQTCRESQTCRPTTNDDVFIGGVGTRNTKERCGQPLGVNWLQLGHSYKGQPEQLHQRVLDRGRNNYGADGDLPLLGFEGSRLGSDSNLGKTRWYRFGRRAELTASHMQDLVMGVL